MKRQGRAQSYWYLPDTTIRAQRMSILQIRKNEGALPFHASVTWQSARANCWREQQRQIVCVLICPRHEEGTFPSNILTSNYCRIFLFGSKWNRHQSVVMSSIINLVVIRVLHALIEGSFPLFCFFFSLFSYSAYCPPSFLLLLFSTLFDSFKEGELDPP